MVRRNGFHPLNQLRDEMDRLVGDFFGPVTSSPPSRVGAVAAGFPPLNIWEDGENFHLEAEVPGVPEPDLDITVVENELTLRGRRGGDQPEGVAYHRQERGTGEFNRVLRLPTEVDADRVEASLRDGMLSIKLPKAESAKPKKIKVASPAANQAPATQVPPTEN